MQIEPMYKRLSRLKELKTVDPDEMADINEPR
jgi:hypothetical protein